MIDTSMSAGFYYIFSDIIGRPSQFFVVFVENPEISEEILKKD